MKEIRKIWDINHEDFGMGIESTITNCPSCGCNEPHPSWRIEWQNDDECTMISNVCASAIKELPNGDLQIIK